MMNLKELPGPSGVLRVKSGLVCLAVLLATGWRSLCQADETLDFNRDIRPILADACFACHGPDKESRKGDLRLDERDAAIDAGAISPGRIDDSELVARVFSDDPDLVMPPPDAKKKLTANQKATLRRWIAAGAEYQRHWSFIVPQRTQPPEVSDKVWAKNAIDRFVLARLEASGLTPAPEADSRTLFRRLHLDITGLPPTPGHVEMFVTDYGKRGDAALSDWIDRLMKTTAWGEHRARYWLDAARYGDTHGLHFDNYREMWPYRDWVIRSFNANQRFDDFTIEQLAGDLLPKPTDDQLIATGFQRCNITTNEGGTIDEENLANYAVDRVQTFGWVYLGLTTNCGQCHDHKFDPFTMRDFYSLAAFFRNTTQGPKDGNVKDGRGPVLVVPTEADRMRWNALPGEISVAIAKREERKKAARSGFQRWLADVTTESVDASLPSEGLAAHVPLDEGQGNSITVHTAGGSQQLTASGDVTWIPEGKTGSAPQVKAGATFDLAALGDFEKDKGFSYGAWVRTARNNASAGIIARMDEKASHRGWDLWQNGRSFGAHIIDAWPENGLKVVTSRPLVKPGTWQHVFVTYDGSGKPGGVRIYVDGRNEPLRVEKDALKADASIRTKTPLRLGQRSDAAVFEGGAIQDVRIYSRRLSVEEVSTLARLAALRGILATAPEKRNAKQKSELFSHFLNNEDSEFPSLAATVTKLEAERDVMRGRSSVTHIQKERPDSKPMAHILMRGAYDKPSEQVSAATPAALHAMPDGAPGNRLGLARWLIDPANPLTARVTVNRFWQQVFGQGIVATPEDFGTMGAEPSHPELLDWLAVEFRDSGWNVRHVFKLMLMSATYRQAAIVTPKKLEQDRDNVLLSRGPRFRMDAEMVRDCALAASGLLSRKMYGPGTRPYQPGNIWDMVGLPGGNTRNYVQDSGENLYRRTLYHFWKRMAPPPNLEAFNAPSREVCTVRRERTNTPLQALVTLNDPQFVEAARRLAERALVAGGESPREKADFIARRVLARAMSDREHEIVLAAAKELINWYGAHQKDAAALIAVGESRADDKLDAVQLAAWTMVCNEIMNLDEALNK